MKLIDSIFVRKVTKSRDWFSCHSKVSESFGWYLMIIRNIFQLFAFRLMTDDFLYRKETFVRYRGLRVDIRQSPVALLSLSTTIDSLSHKMIVEKREEEVVDYCTYHSLRIFENKHKCDEENEFLSRKVFHTNILYMIFSFNSFFKTFIFCRLINNYEC